MHVREKRKMMRKLRERKENRQLRGDGSNALSPAGINLDVSPVPLGSTATHDPTGLEPCG
ncbi:hypothetical protein D1868_07530 [Stygiolobus azoricus]|uniref:Uncharacterized protein n=1 Tax=Stygiolobus azoricus TaxID=41675 RepID=A0A650CPS4_9CREN|nr:hypothetical protein D1868_07530 [Stygiolobus azoricus]